VQSAGALTIEPLRLQITKTGPNCFTLWLKRVTIFIGGHHRQHYSDIQYSIYFQDSLHVKMGPPNLRKAGILIFPLKLYFQKKSYYFIKSKILMSPLVVGTQLLR
jgi:hypothetical protein